jgi:aminomuconate-semialdehyde/2-hydroxymuconate-6-semialdehyde dehydrogenase
VIRLQNFIGGEFAAPASGQYIVSPNPTTEEPHAEIPRSGAGDIQLAVAAAVNAFPAWSARRVEERADILDRIANGIEARREELAKAESADQGKTVSISMSLDIPRAAYNFRFFAGAARHELSVAAPMDAHTLSYVRREPIGVAGLISPWNLPLYLLTWKIAPAIVYGNTCVAKPSEMTSHTAFILAEIMRDAGLPAGVVNLVFGLGNEAGQALVEHPDVRLVSFTGGTVTGRKIAQTVAPQLKKLSLELGGKNPTIIFSDADLKKHMKMIVRSSFLNQGEICLCGSRLYVERGPDPAFYNSFVESFVREARELVVGDPSDRKTFMGPLVSREHREKVSSYVDLAKSEGMKVLCGGGPPATQKRGFFFEPTVLVSSNSMTSAPETAAFHASRIQHEEVFGPVVTIAPFDSVDEVVAHANSTRYGLAASVWTQSLSRAHATAARLHAGTVWINTWMTRDLRMPFGGVKESGLGREGQQDSLHFFTEPKTVCLRFD